MKLFNRGPTEEAPSEAAPALSQDANGAPVPNGAPAEPVEDRLALVLDQTVREITEKLARLSSSVETVREERVQFDEKLGKMEDRMRKLTALAEMISSQYNPFLGSEPPPQETVASVQAVTAAKLAAEVVPPTRSLPPRALAPAPAAPARAAPSPAWAETAPQGAFLERVDGSFQNSILLLQWTEMLLKAASRERLPDLLGYYRSLGWIGEDVQDLIATYAKGLQVDTEDRGDWRARVDLHEKSLVFVEKLRSRTP